jgi:hypothetical protein
VLIEDVRAIEGERVCSGQTGDYVRVFFDGDAPLGTLVAVEGERIRADGVGGRLLAAVGSGRQL